MHILLVSIYICTYSVTQVLLPFLLASLCIFLLLVLSINAVLDSIACEYHFLINHISSMTCSVMSGTTREYL